jgi:hypothetical protein
MRLYFSRNYNPRLAVAVAGYLNSPVEFEFASPFARRARAELAGLPLADFPRVEAWHTRLMSQLRGSGRAEPVKRLNRRPYTDTVGYF